MKKSNPLKTFNDNYDKKVKKVTEGNKKLVKAQTGVSTGTPFQYFVKNYPGATAKDTLPEKVGSSAISRTSAKEKVNPTLQKAYKLTYGDYKTDVGGMDRFRVAKNPLEDSSTSLFGRSTKVYDSMDDKTGHYPGQGSDTTLRKEFESEVMKAKQAAKKKKK
jgi:hypothetical protein